MEVKTTRYYKRIKILDIVQYLIASTIGICFLLWLLTPTWNFLPNNYPELSRIVISGIVLQIIISILRLRIMGMFLELFILFIASLSLIPYVGYFFRFLGIIFILLELATFRSYEIYKHVDIKHVRPKESKQEYKKDRATKSIHTKKEVKDADFEEK